MIDFKRHQSHFHKRYIDLHNGRDGNVDRGLVFTLGPDLFSLALLAFKYSVIGKC